MGSSGWSVGRNGPTACDPFSRLRGCSGLWPVQPRLCGRPHPQLESDTMVKDLIKEVEELREERNELYNEITRCFGNEKCLAEFELLDMSPGSKLHGLGLRALDLSGSAMSRMREE